MPRKMGNAEFRKYQWLHRFDDHIAPLNRLVDELCNIGKAPYIAPIYGGINAKLLSILRDPGPKTQLEENGSGFLCLENDDATAEKMCELVAEAGIDTSEMVTWNTYPWYINRAPNATELRTGIAPLKKLIDLLPKLQVVILHGVTAQNGWKKFTRSFPNIIEERELCVINTYHTSRQAFWHPDEEIRKARRQHLRDSMHRAASILREKQISSHR